MWTTTDDPADDYSNHWRNAPEPEDENCPHCGSDRKRGIASNDGEWFYCIDCGEDYEN